MLSRVDEIVAPSGYLVDVFREFGLKAVVVPNVVDLSQFHYRERNPLSSAPGLHAWILGLLQRRCGGARLCRSQESVSRGQT